MVTILELIVLPAQVLYLLGADSMSRVTEHQRKSSLSLDEIYWKRRRNQPANTSFR